jgi:DNA polymerase
MYAMVEVTERPAVEDAFASLYEEIADCPRCVLARTRSRTVPGSGPSTADIMFIGEAPGAREDELGYPFVGAAGKFLDDLLRGIGLSRETVYICNVVKCRPPGNRDPEAAEIAACSSYLDRQIAIVDPKVIVTLGRFSMARWFPGVAISRIQGQPKRVDGRLVVPMFHPAAALHRGDLRAVIEADFARLPELLAQEVPVEVTAAPSDVSPTSVPQAHPSIAETAQERLL